MKFEVKNSPIAAKELNNRAQRFQVELKPGNLKQKKKFNRKIALFEKVSLESSCYKK